MPFDFNEFGKGGSDLLESMTKEILERRGLKEVERTGKGTDEGKDVVFKEVLQGSLSDYEKDWIVDCKFKSNPKRSVTPADIRNQSIRQIMDRNNANAYLLVTNTRPSSNLYKDIKSVQAEKGYFATYWDRAQLEKELYHHPDIVKRYLPENYQRIVGELTKVSQDYLSEFDDIETELSPAIPVSGGWHAYYRGRDQGYLHLSGNKSRQLLVEARTGSDFAVRAPMLSNPRKLMANFFRCEARSNSQFTIHLMLLAENRNFYYLTYETSNGTPERKEDTQNMLYAKYHLGESFNNGCWNLIERSLDDDLEYLYQTRVFFVEAVLFNVLTKAEFRKIQFLQSKGRQ